MIIPIRGLAQTGLQLDVLDFEVSPNGFSDGVNVRIKNGAITRIPGRRALFKAEGVKRVYTLNQSTGRGLVAILDDGKTKTIKRYTSIENPPQDVTPDGGITTTDWNLAQHGEFLLASSDGTAPMYLAPGADKFEPLPGWDAITDNGQDTGKKLTAFAGHVISYKNHLVALRTQLGANAQSGNILWSDPLSSDEIATSWNYGAVDSTSGLDYAPATFGDVVTVEPIGNAVMIYQRYGISRLSYVGSPRIYDISPVSTDRGLLNKYAVAQMRGWHYCVDDTKIYAWNGQQPLFIADNQVQEWFNENRGDPDKVQVVALPENNEVWIMFADQASSVANQALIYNVLLKAWTKRNLPATAEVLQIIDAPQLPRKALTIDDLDRTNVQESRTYSELASTTTSRNETLMIDDTGQIYQAMNGYQHSDADYSDAAELLQQAIDLEQVTGNAVRFKSLRALYPQIVGTGSVEITVGGHNSTNENHINWGRPQVFEIGKDKKVDLRGNYRYLSIRLRQQGSGDFKLSGWDLDVVAGGKR
ncbi:hypothetical protein [Thalassospira alkalitolerans]|uniref:hypothetical protein n=1 Tax=Thalassospira alkalitolerans TaxID=1293890 RepID=UPI003AA8C8EB